MPKLHPFAPALARFADFKFSHAALLVSAALAAQLTLCAPRAAADAEGSARLIPATEHAAATHPQGEAAPAVAAKEAPAEGTAASNAPIVALLDFESDTLTPDQVQALSAALFTRMAVQGGVRLLPREATRAWLISNDFYPAMPYQQPVGLDRVARALKADQVVTGRIDRVQNAWNFELALQKEDETQPHRIAQTRTGDLDDIMLMLDKTAAQAKAAALGNPIPAPDRVRNTEPPSRRIKQARPMKSRASAGNGVVESITTAAAPAHKKMERQVAMLESAGEPPLKLDSKPMAEHTEAAPAAAATEHAEEPRTQLIPAEPKTTVPPQQKAISTEPPAKPESAPKPKANAKKHGSEPMHGEAHGEAVPQGNTEAGSKRLEPSPSPTPTPASEAHAPEARKPTAQGLYQEALGFEHNTPERLSKLEQAAALDPNDADVQLHLANEYYGHDKFDKAAAACEAALRKRPNNSMLQTIRGSALFELHKYPEAREAHAAAIKADPKNNWARYNYALAAAQMQAPDAAEAWRDYLTHAQSDPAQAALVDRAKEQLAALTPVTPAPGGAGAAGSGAAH